MRIVLQFIATCGALMLACLATPANAEITIQNTGQAAFTVAPGTANAHELSGLAFVGGTTFLAVSDSGASVYELSVSIDPANGQIQSAAVQSGLALAAGSDLEGLAIAPDGALLVSDESGPAIRRHDELSGALIASVAVPTIYGQARSNFSLESLSYRLAPSAANDELWTANEEALLVDGPLSTNASGSTVRLQRFDAGLAPAGQWAYVTDPYPGGPFFNLERSGVADLLALEGGELLVLERSFSNQGFRTRIYLVDFTGTTDTTALASLASDPHVPVGKQLLFELSGGFQNNYEGLALGPPLASGEQSLLLVSDDAGGTNAQSLYALRIEIEEPAAVPVAGAAVRMALAALLACDARRRLRTRVA